MSETPPFALPQYQPPTLFLKVRDLVESEFKVQDAYLEFGVPTFVIANVPTKKPFKRLALKMKRQGYYPSLRRELGRLVIRVAPKPVLKPPRMWINIVLLLATATTVFIDGYLHSSHPVFASYLLQLSFLGIILQSAIYTGAIMAIFGLHEVGHKIACEFDRVESTLPYFVPGVPGVLPTFGAVIMQREPPVNRDQLFDIGVSGPLTGFAVVLITVLAFQSSFLVPESQALLWEKMGVVQFMPSPLLFHIIGGAVSPTPDNFVIFLPPIGYAAWLGAVVTFLNLMPAWQLDGGHIARAVFGPKWHRNVSIISVVAMFLIGWWTMALFLAIFMGRAQHPGPLDDVSSLSKKRKIIALSIVAILVLCTVIMV